MPLSTPAARFWVAPIVLASLAALSACTSATPSTTGAPAGTPATQVPATATTPATSTPTGAAPGNGADQASGDPTDPADLVRRGRAAEAPYFRQKQTFETPTGGTISKQDLKVDATERPNLKMMGTVESKGTTQQVVQIGGVLYTSDDGGRTYTQKPGVVPSSPSEAEAFRGATHFTKVGPRTVEGQACTEYRWEQPATGMRPATITPEPNVATRCVDAQYRTVAGSTTIASYKLDGTLEGHYVMSYVFSEFGVPVTVTAPAAGQVTATATPTASPSR